MSNTGLGRGRVTLGPLVEAIYLTVRLAMDMEDEPSTVGGQQRPGQLPLPPTTR